MVDVTYSKLQTKIPPGGSNRKTSQHTLEFFFDSRTRKRHIIPGSCCYTEELQHTRDLPAYLLPSGLRFFKHSFHLENPSAFS